MISSIKKIKWNNRESWGRVWWQVYVISDQRIRRGFSKEMPLELRLAKI